MSVPCNAHLIWHPFIGVCWHDSLLVSIPPIETKLPHIDFDVVNGLFFFSLPTAVPGQKISHGETLDLGVSMMGRLTDATFIVPHVPIPPVPFNALLPFIILFGSSKILMGSSKTWIWTRNAVFHSEEESQVGCCLFPHVPLSLNLQCWDPIPLPTDVVIAPNTVQVGVTGADYLAALIDFAIEVALAILIMVAGAAVKKGIKKSGVAEKAKVWWQAKKLAKAEKTALKESEAVTRLATKKVAAQGAEEASEKESKEIAERLSSKAVKAYNEALKNEGAEAAEKAYRKALLDAQREAYEEAFTKALKAGGKWSQALGNSTFLIALAKASLIKLPWKLALKPLVVGPWYEKERSRYKGRKNGGDTDTGQPPAVAPPSPSAPSPDHQSITLGLSISRVPAGPLVDPDIEVDNTVFDALPSNQKLAWLLGVSAGMFGTDMVQMMHDGIAPLVSDAFGHGQDYDDPRKNAWGGEWQIFRAE